MLCVRNLKTNPGTVFISMALLIISIRMVSYSIGNFGGPVWLFAVITNNFLPFYYLIPVFFYFYVRGSFTSRTFLVKKDIFHFLPFIISFISVLPYLFTGFEHKMEIAGRMIYNYYEFSRYDFGNL